MMRKVFNLRVCLIILGSSFVFVGAIKADVSPGTRGYMVGRGLGMCLNNACSLFEGRISSLAADDESTARVEILRVLGGPGKAGQFVSIVIDDLWQEYRGGNGSNVESPRQPEIGDRVVAGIGIDERGFTLKGSTMFVTARPRLIVDVLTVLGLHGKLGLESTVASLRQELTSSGHEVLAGCLMVSASLVGKLNPDASQAVLLELLRSPNVPEAEMRSIASDISFKFQSLIPSAKSYWYSKIEEAANSGAAIVQGSALQAIDSIVNGSGQELDRMSGPNRLKLDLAYLQARKNGTVKELRAFEPVSHVR